MQGVDSNPLPAPCKQVGRHLLTSAQYTPDRYVQDHIAITPTPAYYVCMAAIYSTPERGPPLPLRASTHDKTIDLSVRVAAASETVHKLSKRGMRIEPLTDDDKKTVSAVMAAYANDPEATSRISNNSRIGTMTPAALRALDATLKEFGENVVGSSTQLRHFVTNKLIAETDNPDPRIRVRALELLGKISDVGLFAEKTEVTVTHQTSKDLKEALRAKLTSMVTIEVEDAEIIEGATVPAKPTPPVKAKKLPSQVSTEIVRDVNLSAALDDWGFDVD